MLSRNRDRLDIVKCRVLEGLGFPQEIYFGCHIYKYGEFKIVGSTDCIEIDLTDDSWVRIPTTDELAEWVKEKAKAVEIHNVDGLMDPADDWFRLVFSDSLAKWIAVIIDYDGAAYMSGDGDTPPAALFALAEQIVGADNG